MASRMLLGRLSLCAPGGRVNVPFPALSPDQMSHQFFLCFKRRPVDPRTTARQYLVCLLDDPFCGMKRR